MVLHPCKQLYSHPLRIQLETDDGRIVINEIPDAIYQKNLDTLIFRNPATISSISD